MNKKGDKANNSKQGGRWWLVSGLAMAAGLGGCSDKDSDSEIIFTPPANVVFLDQGWDHAARDKLSYTSFGSRIIPYAWFLALEQPHTDTLLRDNSYLQRLGFISSPPSKHNPDGLPVGITRDGKGSKAWVGLTCAACHTGQVSINGQQLRIDGGQALIDYTAFEEAIHNSMLATLADAEKFARFAARVQAAQRHKPAITDAAGLRAELQQRADYFAQRFAINATDVPYGHGRLDAFGQIFNAIAVEALQLPANRHSPNAPTSFPVLWDASHLDLVQWNASAPNKEPGPLFQNAITALAVYGDVTVPKGKLTYRSSIRIHNLGYIQNEFYKLRAPQWPEQLAGAIDAGKAAAGEKLYQQHCVECHQLVDGQDKKRKLRAVLTPAADVGTDLLMVNNFNNLQVKTGVLEGDKAMVLFGSPLAAEVSPMEVVLHVAVGALLNQPWQTTRALLKEYQSNYAAPAQTIYNSYKARPINGIWASGPYLHNGSVPTVYDLLLPAAERPQLFYVGNPELDLRKLGHISEPAEGLSELDTRLPGNANTGHEYATDLRDEQRWELIEYIKTL